MQVTPGGGRRSKYRDSGRRNRYLDDSYSDDDDDFVMVKSSSFIDDLRSDIVRSSSNQSNERASYTSLSDKFRLGWCFIFD